MIVETWVDVMQSGRHKVMEERVRASAASRKEFVQKTLMILLKNLLQKTMLDMLHMLNLVHVGKMSFLKKIMPFLPHLATFRIQIH